MLHQENNTIYVSSKADGKWEYGWDLTFFGKEDKKFYPLHEALH